MPNGACVIRREGKRGAVWFRAFVELTEEGESERASLEQARVIFLTVVSAGLRSGEILGLRWKDVELADLAGAVLRVHETFVRGGGVLKAGTNFGICR